MSRPRDNEPMTTYYSADYGARPSRYRFGEGRQGATRGTRPTRCGRGGPYVRVPVVAGLLSDLVDELGIPTVASLAGLSARQVWRIMNGEGQVTTWEIADRLITDALDDPSLWWTEPELELVDIRGRSLSSETISASVD